MVELSIRPGLTTRIDDRVDLMPVSVTESSSQKGFRQPLEDLGHAAAPAVDRPLDNADARE